MATLLLRPLLRPRTLGIGVSIGVGLSLAAIHISQQQPIRLDSTTAAPKSSGTKVPSPALHGRWLKPGTVRQISGGSITGICAGLAISTFSRSLALLIGLLVLGVQWASSHGIDILPYKRIGQYVTSVDLKSVIQDDPAFKISFGSTFALAAFMHF